MMPTVFKPSLKEQFMALILDGKSVAAALKQELQAEVAELQQQGVTPRLDIVQVEGDAASAWYVRAISRVCQQVAVAFQLTTLPPSVEQHELEAKIEAIGGQTETHGIIIQLPLPKQLNSDAVIARLNPEKDVDGLHPVNLGRLAQGLPSLVPNTPAGGIELLRRYNISAVGKRAVVVGRSNIVGKPMALLLLQQHATVTLAHSRTENLAEVVRDADIVVAAVGKPGLINGNMLKEGAVIIDFGINEVGEGQIVGDVDFNSAVEVASAITPVPGGTGPVTNMMLIRNVLSAARSQQLSR
jgi:methylenetetrahydrofolate dehydrogenase (NADP+)/methenyltetrahydrofolate cyclohydrolase